MVAFRHSALAQFAAPHPRRTRPSPVGTTVRPIPPCRFETLLRTLFLALSILAFALDASGAESLQTESRTPYRHVIPIRDSDGNMITLPPLVDDNGKLVEARGSPFSTAQTCGRCHDYSAISQGWHFNAASTNTAPGRPGEPWILTDPSTRTQIPLSYRDWPGTFRPAALGLSDFDFLTQFARHFPGGGVGEPAPGQISTNDVRQRRMRVTGPLEIDCLICHNRHGDYDHEARYKAVSGENFKWAATIASELGAYGASRPAKAFADAWRPPRPAPTNLPPIKYERHRFDVASHVTFEVTRRAPSGNCFYCHTSESHLADSRWHSDGDIHLRAGMSCTDCHRNGIDHQIVRGYENETHDRTLSAGTIGLRSKLLRRDNPELTEAAARTQAETELKGELAQVGTLSCQGCHYGVDASGIPGRLGAPKAAHAGFPPIHFEKLACTACHSGPIPDDAAEIVHTSLAHRLGLPGPTRGSRTAPMIVQPVFLKTGPGKIAPHKMVWPSYWGWLSNGVVSPLLPDAVVKAAGDSLPQQASEDVERDPYNTRPYTENEIGKVLAALQSTAPQATPVFVAAGKLFQRDGDNVRAEEHAAAKPYAWPIGHDVRPANQALGAKGCADCHSEKAPIYFGTVASMGPVPPTHQVSKDQLALRGDNREAVSAFAFTFRFRPMLKVVTLGCAVLVLGALARRFLGLNAGRRTSHPSA